MAAFFDTRAAGYDDHMRDNVFPDATFAQFYQALSSPIGRTDEPLHILDLGCGCGLTGIVLARLGLCRGSLFASDISENAVAFEIKPNNMINLEECIYGPNLHSLYWQSRLFE